MAEHDLKSQQEELIFHLLHPGDIGLNKAPDWLQAIPTRPLKLIADLALKKRMSKINSVFPTTFDHLEDLLKPMEIEFASTCVQTEIWKKTNALQFLKFLGDLANDRRSAPPYIYDLAQLEYAIWQVAQEGASEDRQGSENGILKLNPLVELISCEFNVRSLVDGSIKPGNPTRKKTLLAVAPVKFDGTPTVTELPADIFAWLKHLKSSRSSNIAKSEIDQLLGLDIVEFSA